MCGLVEVMWVQMMAMKMFGSVMSLLFMIGVWKCHLDTWFCARIILTYPTYHLTFYLALYRHMTYVGSRACYRTALELCKVILNLDPAGDPLGITLVMDFFALRANQHNWLLRVFNEWEPSKNLSQLPNMAYSVAVAKFYRSNQARDILRECSIADVCRE